MGIVRVDPRHASVPDPPLPPVVNLIGTLDKDLIRRTIRQHINEVKFCYEQQLTKKPDLDGRLLVKFVIGGTGLVLSSQVENSTLHEASVEQCVVTAVRRWSFPRPQGGGIVVVSYPFGFKVAGGG